MEYRFASNDTFVKQVVEKVKAQAIEKAQEEQTAEEKVEPEKTEVKGDCQ